MSYVIKCKKNIVGWVYWTGKIADGIPSFSIYENDAAILTQVQAHEDITYIKEKGWEICQCSL